MIFNENAKNIGAKVILTTASGKTLTEDYIIGEGLVSDQSSSVHFGLGQEEIKSIQIKYIDGLVQDLADFKINTSSVIPEFVQPENTPTEE